MTLDDLSELVADLLDADELDETVFIVAAHGCGHTWSDIARWFNWRSHASASRRYAAWAALPKRRRRLGEWVAAVAREHQELSRLVYLTREAAAERVGLERRIQKLMDKRPKGSD